jgi:hypothetical protein
MIRLRGAVLHLVVIKAFTRYQLSGALPTGGKESGKWSRLKLCHPSDV